MKIHANMDICTGHARCQVIAPEVYQTDLVEGKIILLFEEVPTKFEQQALRGARSCPERAVTVISDAGEIVWPPQKR